MHQNLRFLLAEISALRLIACDLIVHGQAASPSAASR
jgi:hypothetical protein